MQTKFSLRYSGPAVDSGQMGVYDVATNMIAFSDYVVAAAKIVYGEKVDAKADVAGFGQGSFITDLVVNFGGVAATLFSAGHAKELIETLNASIGLWKHLKGHPPAEVKPINESRVEVTNNNGQVITVNAHTLHLVMSDKPSEAVGKFVKDALGKEGVDEITVDAFSDSDDKPAPFRIVDVSKDESHYFVPVVAEESLVDTEYRSALIIEAPVFKDGNKWRFSDGSGSFYADIEDRDFLKLVDDGEPFAKGDSLIVRLRVCQRRQGDKLLTDKTIVEVLEHKRRPSQAGMFL